MISFGGLLTKRMKELLFSLNFSVTGVPASVPVGLVHGCSFECAAGACHHAFHGEQHIQQGPVAGLHLQSG